MSSMNCGLNECDMCFAAATLLKLWPPKWTTVSNISSRYITLCWSKGLWYSNTLISFVMIDLTTGRRIIVGDNSSSNIGSSSLQYSVRGYSINSWFFHKPRIWSQIATHPCFSYSPKGWITALQGVENTQHRYFEAHPGLLGILWNDRHI